MVGDLAGLRAATGMGDHQVRIPEPVADVGAVEGTDAAAEQRGVVVEPGQVHRSAALGVLGIGRSQDVLPLGDGEIHQFDGFLVRESGLIGLQDGLGLGLAELVADHGHGAVKVDVFEFDILLAQGELGRGGAEHQGHVPGHIVLEEAVGGKDRTVSDRGETAADFARNFVGQGVVLFPRHLLEFLHIAADGLEDGRTHGGGGSRIRGGSGIAAQGYRLVYQSLGRRHGDYVAHFGAAAGLAHDGHVAGVAAEVRDVVMDPLQGRDEVQDTYVAGVLEVRTRRGEVGEAEGVEPMVHAHEDDVAAAGEVRPVIAVLLDAVAGGKAATVHPHKDRALLSVRRRSPHVQVQAVFADIEVVPVVREGGRIVPPLVGHVLGRVVPVEHRRTDAFPGFGLLRRQEAVFTAGRRPVRDAQISVHTVQDVALDLSVLRLGNGIVVTDEQALPIFLGGFFATACAGDREDGRNKELDKFHDNQCLLVTKIAIRPEKRFLPCSNI